MAEREPPIPKKRAKPRPRAKLDFKALLAEAEAGAPSSTPAPTTQDLPKSTHPQISTTHYSEGPRQDTGVDEYDPTNPLLALQSLVATLKANPTSCYSSQPKDRFFKNSPHIVEHMLSGAPYTASLCTRCSRHRKCRMHREVYTPMTSVSLCNHLRMNLWWAVNDPTNAKGSWRLTVKDYIAQDNTMQDSKLELEHRACKAYRPSERVGLLAGRVIEDMQMQRESLRVNLRRVADEIHALLGAWETSQLQRLEAKEKKRLAEEQRKEKKRESHERLAETVRVVQQLKEKEEKEKQQQQAVQPKKRKLSKVEDTEIVEVEIHKKPRVERRVTRSMSKTAMIGSKARTPSDTRPTTPESIKLPTQEPTKCPSSKPMKTTNTETELRSTCSVPIPDLDLEPVTPEPEVRPSSPPAILITPPTSPPNKKRKRSSNATTSTLVTVQSPPISPPRKRRHLSASAPSPHSSP